MTKRKVNPLTCKDCLDSKPSNKYYPYCTAEHWKIAIRAEPK